MEFFGNLVSRAFVGETPLAASLLGGIEGLY